MGNARNLGSLLNTSSVIQSEDFSAGVLDPENRIINGAFDFWQRGASFTTSGVYTSDRWISDFSGGTVTTTRQAFPLGTTLGSNNPTYFLRHAASGQSTSSHYAILSHRIESVRSYAGQTITVLGWVRVNTTPTNMAFEAIQYFGTGGSPSAVVLNIGVTTVALTTSWAPFAITINVPSISGKTLGSDNNHSLGFNFWISEGGARSTRTNSLGLQEVEVDFWGIHIKQGTHTTSAVDLYRQPQLGPELARCQRYCVVYGGNSVYERFGLGINATTTQSYPMIFLPTEMRANPSVSVNSTSNFALWNGVNLFNPTSIGVDTAASSTKLSGLVVSVASGLTATAPTGILANNTTAARLTLDAEL